MADEEAIKLLKRSVAEWNAWRKSNAIVPDLSGADLSSADLSNAKNLTQMQVEEACGDANTKLPEGLTLKPCPPSQ